MAHCSDLLIFDIKGFENIYSNHLRYEKNGIEISLVDFGNTNFVFNEKFVNKCRNIINEYRKSVDFNELSDGINGYDKIEIVFKNCKFTDITINEEIILDDIFLENDIEDKNLDINFIRVTASEFNEKFYINKQYDGNDKELHIKKLIIENTTFKHNFKLHHCITDEILLKDTDFEKNADFYLSHFESGIKENINIQAPIEFKALNFNGLALFGDTKFHKKFYLKYVTLEGYSHFRNAEFNEGLNLDYANIQNEMNFFGSKGLKSDISKNNTSQETYRIIKHQFEKLGNKIEANKYHALELEQKRKKLEEEKGDWKERLVFMFHDLSSKHSTNWFRALLWIVFIGSITVLLNQSFWFILLPPIIYFLSTKCNDIISFKLSVQILSFAIVIGVYPNIYMDDIFKFISILTKEDDFCYNYFLMTFNKVSLGYLYYQFLMSVRKDTRK